MRGGVRRAERAASSHNGVWGYPVPVRRAGMRRIPALQSCVPSMTIGLEVKVLSGVDRNNRSEPQGGVREEVAESSGEHDLRGDV